MSLVVEAILGEPETIRQPPEPLGEGVRVKQAAVLAGDDDGWRRLTPVP